MRISLAIAALLVLAGAGPSPGEGPQVDVEKALAYGLGTGDIPQVVQGDAVGRSGCERAELAGPALRVARLGRKSRLEGREADGEAVSRAARATLSTLYAREPFEGAGQQWTGRSSGILTPPAAPAPVPCPEDRRPLRLVLVGPSGSVLETVGETSQHERKWTGRLGRSGTGLDVVGEFDLGAALALAGGKGLDVRVLYAEGKPSSFHFTARQLRDLTPSWAR